MTELNPKFVTAKRLLNRRTAPKPTPSLPRIHPSVAERLSSLKARNKFGLRLIDQWRLAHTQEQHQILNAWLILGGMLATLSIIALILSFIQTSLGMAVLGVAGLISSGVLILVGRRLTKAETANTPSSAGLFDEASLMAFDDAIEQLAPDVSDEISAHLVGLKQQIFRIAKLSMNNPVDVHLMLDDRLYLIESLRRYLPDSIQSFLQVPNLGLSSVMAMKNA